MSWWRRLFGSVPKPAAHLKAWGFVTDEATVRARVEVEELNAYIEAIASVFRDYFASLPPDAGRDVFLECSIRPEGKVHLPISTTVDGFLDQDVLGPLFQRLFALPVPRVKEGPVEFQAVFALWGGSARRPFGV
jgi:hypothetical protein